MRGLTVLSAIDALEAASFASIGPAYLNDFRYQRKPGTPLSRLPAARMRGYTEPQGRQQRRAFNRGYVGCMY